MIKRYKLNNVPPVPLNEILINFFVLNFFFSISILINTETRTCLSGFCRIQQCLVGRDVSVHNFGDRGLEFGKWCDVTCHFDDFRA